MRDGIFPIFTKGRVVKTKSIEYLRDFPKDLASLVFENYSDGVLFGFSIGIKEGNVLISNGAVKYQGDVLLIPAETVMLSGYGHLRHVKLVVGDRHETQDFITRQIEIVVDGQEAKAENELELGRFCLNTGAKLRADKFDSFKYDSFDDLRTPENTLDITHVSYAGEGMPTLHPRILKEFALALLMGPVDAVDTAFGLMCLNSAVVHKASIQWYVAKKEGSQYEDFSLSALYDKLACLLPQNDLANKPKKIQRRGPIITDW